MKAEVRSSQESANHDPHQERVRKHLSVNFLVYRNLIAKHLLDNPRKKMTKEAMKEIHRDFATYWYDLFNPVVAEGLGTSDEEFIRAAVGKYSGDLAEQINDVSDKAFIEGFNAAVNKGWDRAVAWDRIATNYGLDPAQMRSWVLYYPTEGYHPEELPAKSKDQAERMLYDRANRIASHEAWSLKQLGKQAEWTQKIMKGDLPKGTKKIWVTAQDELVCPVCAPMDNIVVDVTEQFKTTSGKFFAPPVHINCRCEIYLQFDEVIKSMGNDRWNRDKRGRFSRFEQRSGNPKIKVRGAGYKLEPKKQATEGFAATRGQDTTGRAEIKAEEKAEAKPEAKTETKTAQNTDIDLGKRPARQSRQNTGSDKRLKIDIEDDWILSPTDIGEEEDIPTQGDLVRISQNHVLSGTEVNTLMRRAEKEYEGYPRAHFYVINTADDFNQRLSLGLDVDATQETTYVVGQTMLIQEGETIDPDLARVFGVSGEGVSHSRDETPDEERSYYVAPKEIMISRLNPFIRTW